MKVLVYPNFDACRYSHSIDGLMALFGQKNIIYTAKDFPAFHQHCLAFVLAGERPIRIYLAAGDGPGLNNEGLAWADLYVKLTFLQENVTNENRDKLMPMGPRFEFRCWNLLGTIEHAVRTYRAQASPRVDVKTHFMTYFQQWYFRAPMSSYTPGESDPNYIYYVSTLYPTFPQYNHFRSLFIRAAMDVEGMKFEGGLVRKDDWRDERYRDITITKYDSPHTWVRNSKRSLLGFWTPGDQGALTVKMAEYMALGKAIISTPLRSEQYAVLPRHGMELHVVDGSYESIRSAIELIRNDKAYRRHLEQHARRYYETHLTPTVSMKRYVDEAVKRVDETHAPAV